MTTALEPEKDLTHRVGDDAAFLTIIDLGSYSKDLPEWDYTTLTDKLAADMSAGRVFAWGCCVGPVQVRLSRTPPSPDLVKERHAFLTSTLVVTGPLCLVGYSSITMCAQFEDEEFPQDGDLEFSLPPGRYAVTVSRRFAHEAGAQYPEGGLPEGDAYVVTFEPTDAPLVKATRVAWAPQP